MQSTYSADHINIRLLNEDADYALLDQPDPQGMNLVAVLQGRTELQEFQLPGLGFVELREDLHLCGATISMKIDGQAAAAGECVWEQFASQRSWVRIRKFADAIVGGMFPSQPFSPMSPWLCAFFFPDLYQQLLPAQRTLATAILWGRAYQVRKRVTAMVTFN